MASRRCRCFRVWGLIFCGAYSIEAGVFWVCHWFGASMGFEVSSSGVGLWCSEGFVSQIWFQARNSGWCCGLRV